MILPETTVMNDTWKVMNDLEVAFSEITTFNFMLEQLQDAVDNGLSLIHI